METYKFVSSQLLQLGYYYSSSRTVTVCERCRVSACPKASLYGSLNARRHARRRLIEVESLAPKLTPIRSFARGRPFADFIIEKG